MNNETTKDQVRRLIAGIAPCYEKRPDLIKDDDYCFGFMVQVVELAIAEEREAKKRGERVKAFKIMVTKCANAEKRIKECPHADSNGYSHDFCGIAKLDGRTEYNVYRDNEDGLTPSCPMWSETVEVSE